MEYGGYIELDQYMLPMLHEEAVKLNCGRNCLSYLIKTKKIKKIFLPYLICDSVIDLCIKENVSIKYYNINDNFLLSDVKLQPDEWLYLINYYGQLTSNQLCSVKEKYKRVIIDNAQAYFDQPLSGVDTIYTCRKFFGVADGAFLYTDILSDETYDIDESFKRMSFLLGRFERTASEFYSEYVENNHIFASEPIKQMSKLTRNLLHGIDYKRIKDKRTENFAFYHERLHEINQLKLRCPEGAFAYPLLLENGDSVRKSLQKLKIYVPTLWPNVVQSFGTEKLEYFFASNILPLPCDQRYGTADIDYIIICLNKILN